MHLQVKLSPPNGKAKREIIVDGGTARYVDMVDPADGFSRQKVLERLAGSLGVSVGDLAELDDEIIRLAMEPAVDEQVKFHAVTCQELAQAEYNVNFLIDDTLVEMQPAIIGAAPKSCKTLLAIDAAISLATATPFLGSLEVKQAARVAYFSGEGGLSVLQEYAHRIAEGRGWHLADVPGLVFCDSLPQLADLRHIDAFESFLKDWEIGVAFLDPLYLCMPGDDAGNLLKQGKVLRLVNQVCVRNGCTPVLIHHTKRNPVDAYAPPELSDLSWAGFSEFAGQWWMLGRREKYNADEPGEHKLWLNVGGRAGHSALHALDVHEGSRRDFGGRRWAVDVLSSTEARQATAEAAQAKREAAGEEKAAKQLDSDRTAICRLLAKHPDGESKTFIKDSCGVRSSRFPTAFASLLSDGGVVPCEITKSNWKRPIEGYKLGEGCPI